MGEEKTGMAPEEQLKQLFGQTEKRAASAMEELVQRDSFGEILARVTENVMGLTKIGFDVLDMAVRNLRLAGRPDLIRVGRQLARNEDKLERVLQEVERLQDEVRELAKQQAKPAARSRSSRSTSSSSSNGRSRSSGRSRSGSKSS
jgi:hypothetical protein